MPTTTSNAPAVKVVAAPEEGVAVVVAVAVQAAVRVVHLRRR
jgi:hypothetical protein